MRTYTRHGLCYHPLYRVWQAINARCHSKNSKNYKDYGGRGIKNFWRDDLKGFVEYIASLENYGTKGLTIDRIDNDKGYEPNNLRLASRGEQQKNKRNNVKFNGETMAEASRRLGGDTKLVRQRLLFGWTLEEAFNTPVNPVGKTFRTKGKNRAIDEDISYLEEQLTLLKNEN